MRIRNFRQGDIPILFDLQQLAAETDGFAVDEMIDFVAWSTQPELEYPYIEFVITDDDETNEWGQAGTLEGAEGEDGGGRAVSREQDARVDSLLCSGRDDQQ